jgi:hypothetical protein
MQANDAPILRKIFAELEEIEGHLFGQRAMTLGHGFPAFEVSKALFDGSEQFAGSIWVHHGAQWGWRPTNGTYIVAARKYLCIVFSFIICSLEWIHQLSAQTVYR